MAARKASSGRGEEAAHPFARLLERLDGGLSCRLILVVAPAKSGKTALLQRWVERLSKRDDCQIAWVSLNIADNASQTFLSDLTAALQNDIEINALTPPGTESSGALYLEDSFIELINLLAGESHETILILDHYDLIVTPAVHAAVGLMLDYLPPQAHLVIASQTEPPLQIARLRARRQVLELGLEDF